MDDKEIFTDEALAKFIGVPLPNLNEDEHKPAINQEPLAATDVDFSEMEEIGDDLENLSEIFDFEDKQHTVVGGTENPTANQYPIEQHLVQNPIDSVGPSINHQNLSDLDALQKFLMSNNVAEPLGSTDGQPPFVAGIGNPTANQYANPTSNVGPSINYQNFFEGMVVPQDTLLLGSTDGQLPFVPVIGNPTANQYPIEEMVVPQDTLLLGSTDGQLPFVAGIRNPTANQYAITQILAQNPTYNVGLSINNQNLCDELSASSSQMPSYIIAVKNAPHKFSFKVTPVGRLLEGLKALQALCHRDLNRKSKALIEVDGYGFKITVHNESTDVMGRLHLEARFLSEFRYRSPFQKLTQGGLDEILDLLGQDSGKFGYEDTITIFHMAGCSRALCWKFDGANINKCVELAGLVGEQYKKWPVDIIYSCEAELRADFLREIIPLLATSEGQYGAVKIDMIHMDFMEIMISIKNQVPRYTRTVKMAGVPYGQKHRSAFYFPHVESLMKASHLSEWCHVGFQNAPDRILLRFGLENLGGLTYLNPSLTILNCLLD